MPKAAEAIRIYPCACPEGHHLVEPPASLEGLSRDDADALVATKAYSFRPDGQHDEPEAPASEQE